MPADEVTPMMPKSDAGVNALYLNSMNGDLRRWAFTVVLTLLRNNLFFPILSMDLGTEAAQSFASCSGGLRRSNSSQP